MDVITSIVNSVNRFEDERQRIAKEVRVQKPELFKQVQDKPFTGTVIGVDGGLQSKSFHGSDLILTKAVAVVMKYENGKLVNTKYVPNATPQPDIVLSQEGLEREEVSIKSSLQRMRKEISVAIKAVQEHKPNFLFLDGSVVPQKADKPSQSSVLWPQYQALVALYKHMYQVCKDNDCTIVGVVEDSRGRRFTSTIKDVSSSPAFNKVFDTHFLYYLLNKGERTTSFSYTKDPAQHSVLKDFEGVNPTAFYLKTVERDRPLRVEFLTQNEDEVAEVVFALSCFHNDYGCPAPIIEADLRAKFSSNEIDLVYKNVFDRVKLKGSLLEQRRNTRPF